MMTKHRIPALPTLSQLLEGIVNVSPAVDMHIAAIHLDSRKVQSASLFLAIEGLHVSGSRYIQDAIARGAVAILVEASSEFHNVAVRVPVFQVMDLQAKVGLIASRFYGDPSADLFITGITGTNGKTSIAYYLAQAFSDNGTQAVGSIGTLGYGEFGNLVATANTTPDAITIQQQLSQFRARKIHDVVMEVSSHALEQCRVNNVLFNTAVFSNLSRDHLDYHREMSSYGEAKKKLFMMPGLRNAVINMDDSLGAAFIKELDGQIDTFSYGLVDNVREKTKPRPLIEAVIARQEINSLQLQINSPWGSGELISRLSGRFNAYNLLAALTVLCLREIPFEIALEKLSVVRGVPGRMEYFGTAESARIFVDYSHTPDALQQALMSLREKCTGKLVCVFGCGGDRDKGKRPEMGKVAETYADCVILTSDNPRTESPESIIGDIQSGMSGLVPVVIHSDRAIAIHDAISSASKEDIVLIAGKGHETYQEIMSKKLPFSDRQLVRNLLEKTA